MRKLVFALLCKFIFRKKCGVIWLPSSSIIFIRIYGCFGDVILGPPHPAYTLHAFTRLTSSFHYIQVTMRKEEGAKTVVVGGKKDVTQQYCGTVGGQSTDYSTMDTEVKVRVFDFLA